MPTNTKMIDAVYVLEKLGLKPGMSVTRALTDVGALINEGSQRNITVANKIIKSLGGAPETHPTAADVVAKALIEQAVLSGSSYNPDAACLIALEKLAKIRRTMPYVFAEAVDRNGQLLPGEAKRAKKISTRGGDKKERARVIFDREAGKPAGVGAKMIATEIDITYANAYYYVSRVFK